MNKVVIRFDVPCLVDEIDTDKDFELESIAEDEFWIVETIGAHLIGKRTVTRRRHVVHSLPDAVALATYLTVCLREVAETVTGIRPATPEEIEQTARQTYTDSTPKIGLLGPDPSK